MGGVVNGVAGDQKPTLYVQLYTVLYAYNVKNGGEMCLRYEILSLVPGCNVVVNLDEGCTHVLITIGKSFFP